MALVLGLSWVSHLVKPLCYDKILHRGPKYLLRWNIWMFPKMWFIEVHRCKYSRKLQRLWIKVLSWLRRAAVPVALLRDVLTRKMKRRKQIRRRKEGRCMHPDFWEIVCFLPREINSEGAKKLPFQPLKMGFVINNGWKINHF